MDKTLKIQMVLSAIDKMSGTVNKAVLNTQNKLNGISRSADNIAKKGFQYGRQALQIGAVAGAMLYPAINSAIQFEKQMGNVGTLIDANVESMESMGRTVLDISTRVPVQIEDLTSALYDVRSAGISAKDSMAVLEASGRLAVAGLSDTKEATNIMTSAMNAFAAEGLSANQVADLVFKTVKAGKTTVSELSQAFGATAPMIQATGVKLADFQAATAALTTVGTPAAQAQNQLRAAMVSLQRPTANMSKVLKALGVKDGRELIKTTGSMGAAFSAITKKSKSMGLNIEVVAGQIEAASAMTSLAGATNGAYLKTLDEMNNGAEALSEAFGKQTEKAAAQMTMAKNSIDSTMIEIGSVMLPIVAKIAKKISEIVKPIGEWARENPGLAKGVFIAVAAISALLVVLGTVGMLVGGVASGIAAVTSAMAFMGPTITAATAAIKLFSAGFMTIPILGWIAAIIAAGVLIYTYWDEITGYFKGIWTSISSAFESGFMNGVWEILKNLNPLYHISKAFGALTEYFFGFNLHEAGANIINSLTDGIKSAAGKAWDAMKGVVSGIRDFLPFSPAKTGPLKAIQKVRIIETIAETMKPGPALKAMQKVTSVVAEHINPVNMFRKTSGLVSNALFGNESQNGSGPVPELVAQRNSGGNTPIQLHYNPIIHLMGGDDSGNIGDQVLAALSKDREKLLALIDQAISRRSKKQY